VIYNKLSRWDAPKRSAEFSENSPFMHLLEHPFSFCQQNR
jgi:hypothetical protein